MIEYFKANYRAMGERLFHLCRWATFLLWLDSLRFILFVGPASGNWFGVIFWEQLLAWAGVVVGLLMAQWIIIGKVKPEVLLPWTKLGGSEIEAKEG